MSRFVLDNSVVMAWYFEDESNDYTSAILQSLAENEALVSTIWPLEVADVLRVGEEEGEAPKPGPADLSPCWMRCRFGWMRPRRSARFPRF